MDGLETRKNCLVTFVNTDATEMKFRQLIVFYSKKQKQKQKLLVLQSMWKEMPDLIHESNQGIVKCKQRARDILVWPRMPSQIEERVANCSILYPVPEPPDRPWSKIGTDLFEFNGVHYLLSVDYYSKWVEVSKLDSLTSDNISCHLKSQFAR